MAGWIYREIEELSKEAKELLNFSINRKWNIEKQEYEKTLIFKYELNSLTSYQIEEIREALNKSFKKTVNKFVRRRKEKIQRRMDKL